MAGNDNFYTTLGIPRTASSASIRSAYIRLAKECHPDRNSSSSSTERFKKVQEAYAVLRDSEKRAAYDATLPPPLPGAARGYQGGSKAYHGFRGAEWRGDEREFDRQFMEQVERIRREKEQAWNDMEKQRARMSGPSSGPFRGFQSPSPGFSNRGFSPLSHALLRTLPLLFLPCLLLYGVYKQARVRREVSGLRGSPSAVLYDDLGRAFMVDSKGRHYRVMEFDVRDVRNSRRTF
ncbi:hypothetical protein CSUI_002968 [Cystoisospora suis]|uniref:J domain-containing protein n=1 Tax=Cystoisospora suis TaxID=483139 RepID=A0A2C6KS16_9APIC|nr:hypothetical protein CSUI_002968 [Cystoisospora suis]